MPAGLSCSYSSRDRKSTRLNSSHLGISYAVFCLYQTTELELHSPVTVHLVSARGRGGGYLPVRVYQAEIRDSSFRCKSFFFYAAGGPGVLHFPPTSRYKI